VSLVILRSGIDTLEVSFTGELSPGVAETLDKLKERAQDYDAAQRHDESGLCVEPKAFAPWRWRLTSPCYELRLSAGTHPFRPSASIRLGALGLASSDATSLYLEAVDKLDGFGDFNETGVSRADVYADTQGWTPSLDEMRSMSCPASFRPIYPSVEHPETFQYGKGDVVVRVYNKSAEINVSHKAWVVETWKQTGRYDGGQDVWRVEVQVRTKLLKELGMRESGSVLSKPGALFDWVLSQWCQLRIPNGDQKVTRWPEHPVWTDLRAATFAGHPVSRVVPVARLLELEAAAKRLVGLVALAGAYYGEQDYVAALVHLSEQAEAHLVVEQLDFAELVEAKRKRLDARWGDTFDALPF
jgi:hypothetical protein